MSTLQVLTRSPSYYEWYCVLHRPSGAYPESVESDVSRNGKKL